MNVNITVGLDGSATGDRALSHAKRTAKLMGDCHLKLVYVIEWSPYTFQTAEENATRGRRREEEIGQAMSRIVEPTIKALKDEGFEATGIVRHGDAAEILNAVAVEDRSEQIIVGRASEKGFRSRLFGTVTAKLVMSSSVPVTVVS